MKYACEYCSKTFHDEIEALGCEAKHKKVEEEQAKLSAEKEARFKEVQEAYNKYALLSNNYAKDYNEPVIRCWSTNPKDAIRSLFF
jgi:DNA-binding protein H-NS